MQKTITIHSATPEDLGIIVQAQLDMALETENLALDKSRVQKGVKAVFEDPKKGKYYKATVDGEFAGCLLTTFEWSDWRNSYCLWIQSVFVPKNQRGRGVFKSFYLYLKDMVKSDSDLCGLRLYVDKTNKDAQKVYQKVNMSNEHYELFEWLDPGE
ncbi:MAG: GNAT family N-acetyltransferase [Halobacteriovoraceae bacterium]|nr:GNAT family N-acetyltransferase [Halobacteriovoraceae bacterium]|tara:strand:- start:289647 stop:290114 length:468 start_codon:yes stop_codon:yes gene_type:complete